MEPDVHVGPKRIAKLPRGLKSTEDALLPGSEILEPVVIKILFVRRILLAPNSMVLRNPK